MNIFISWSGERSKVVAELLDEWLQCVIQAVDPWMSSKDIDRGSLWFSEISDQLQNTFIGIICLTQENKNKPWILFEAGALAKGLSNSRICTFLIDLVPTDVGTPLSQFNHTLPNSEGLWELVRTLNNSLQERALKEKTLELAFNTYWPQFEASFKEIIKRTPSIENVEKRSDDDILLEILSATRSMDRRVRALEKETTNRIPLPLLNRGAHIKDDARYTLNEIEIRNAIKEYFSAGLSDVGITNRLRKEYGISVSFSKALINDMLTEDNMI